MLVDFDSQANLSIGLGFGPDDMNTIVPVLQEQGDIKDVIQKTSIKGLYLIPSNAYLDGVERTPQLGNDPYAHERLRRALKGVENCFDFCFLDTPPSFGWLTQSAFFASQHSVVCAIPEAYSVIALRRLKEFLNSIRQYHDIDVFGVVLSFWDKRGAVNQDFLDEINASFPDVTFSAKIRRDMLVSRAVLKGKTLFEFNEDSRAAKDYKMLADEFMKRFDCRTNFNEEGIMNHSKEVVENVQV